MEFDGKSVLVTGGSSGIGLAAARLFASRGARVVCADVLGPPADAAEAIRFAPADVTDEEAVAAAVESALRDHGRLDVLVTAAGI
jgi:NAD(P)-dependent dehydrogenase (short-subunit alcohol dehydrogenase family)